MYGRYDVPDNFVIVPDKFHFSDELCGLHP